MIYYFYLIFIQTYFPVNSHVVLNRVSFAVGLQWWDSVLDSAIWIHCPTLTCYFHLLPPFITSGHCWSGAQHQQIRRCRPYHVPYGIYLYIFLTHTQQQLWPAESWTELTFIQLPILQYCLRVDANILPSIYTPFYLAPTQTSYQCRKTFYNTFELSLVRIYSLWKTIYMESQLFDLTSCAVCAPVRRSLRLG